METSQLIAALKSKIVQIEDGHMSRFADLGRSYRGWMISEGNDKVYIDASLRDVNRAFDEVDSLKKLINDITNAEVDVLKDLCP